jgi:hypothetical protein
MVCDHQDCLAVLLLQLQVGESVEQAERLVE